MDILAEVKDWAVSQREYFNSDTKALESVMRYGCVDVLVFDDDAEAFFIRHTEEINAMVAEGLNLKFWDSADPLALHTHNRVLLARYAFERVAGDLYIA